MTADTGTYVLILRCDTAARLRIGRWGVLHARSGYYAYVGSAFGPGGVRARVARHARRGKAMHWHVDYLREHAVLASVWFAHSGTRLEHEWADALAGLAGMEPVNGFGCSDCRCESHLFFSPAEPLPDRFRRVALGTVAVWRPDEAV
ncbi:hypothetical protein KBTX_00723 [wastewater metagenome]|uniref:GIY-YIG domain-containing protein n=2 Tax=unclassified sequences TaxID=12908 RepID=A0A5B8RCB1_9ZZZZ|nr:GIY-YIG nuclease family protein [Arhodomonas sp. KWT]QEA04415.1 hypothetical protein KBTEX_00723 [uncultured organism]